MKEVIRMSFVFKPVTNQLTHYHINVCWRKTLWLILHFLDYKNMTMFHILKINLHSCQRFPTYSNGFIYSKLSQLYFFYKTPVNFLYFLRDISTSNIKLSKSSLEWTKKNNNTKIIYNEFPPKMWLQDCCCWLWVRWICILICH